MKKGFSILFAVLAALAIFTSTALAASASKKVTLLSVEYQKGGIVLLFETLGLTKTDLKDNSFFADSNYQKMSCNFVDDRTVRCTVSKALAGTGDFHATLAGSGFWGELPQEKFFALTCPNGQALWYVVAIYYYGEWYTTSILAEAYDSLAASLKENDPAAILKIEKAFCSTLSS